MAFRCGHLELERDYSPRSPGSPINVDDGAFWESQPNGTFRSPQILSTQSCISPASIAAIAKEFQESKASELLPLIKNSVPIVLVTTQRWDHIPRMVEGMHHIYEGNLTHVHGDKTDRTFTMRLKYPHQAAPIHVQIRSSEVISLLPRNSQRHNSGDCSYFHQHGHCAFGVNCHKAHDPRKLCDRVKESLRSGDISVLDENQQHTLHIAMVENGIDEKTLRADFGMFGALKSVKIEAGKSLLQGSGWRIGFITYQNARDAIRAKKSLNEDPKSRYKGVVQFSKQATKIHSNGCASEDAEKQSLSVKEGSRSQSKPTELLHIKLGQKKRTVMMEDIRNLLSENCFPKHIDISVQSDGESANILFDSINDSKLACNVLLGIGKGEWIVDYHPVDDRSLLRIRFQRWQILRMREGAIVKKLGSFWLLFDSMTDEMKAEKDHLHTLLNSIRSDIREAEEYLTRLTVQSVQQADLYLKRLCIDMDVLHLASEIGPEAIAFAEEKAGSVQEFIDSQRRTTNVLINPVAQGKCSADKTYQPYQAWNDKSSCSELADLPHIYRAMLSHVEKAKSGQFQKIQAELSSEIR